MKKSGRNLRQKHFRHKWMKFFRKIWRWANKKPKKI